MFFVFVFWIVFHVHFCFEVIWTQYNSRLVGGKTEESGRKWIKKIYCLSSI
jgi:hypothetical protein